MARMFQWMPIMIASAIMTGITARNGHSLLAIASALVLAYCICQLIREERAIKWIRATRDRIITETEEWAGRPLDPSEIQYVDSRLIAMGVPPQILKGAPHG